MNLRSTFIIYRKELTDVLRDRRTIISMVLFPLVLMPLLTIGIVTFMKSRIEKIMDQTSMIAWIAPAELDSVKERLAATPSMQLLAEVNDSATIIELIKDKTLDAAVIIPPNFSDRLRALMAGDTAGAPPAITIYNDERRERSGFAVRRVSAVLDGYRSDLTREALVAEGLPPALVTPFTVRKENVVPAEQMGMFLAASFLPYVIILMSLTGAMYPAIDLTAGEKERGTLETLLVSGVARIDIVLGKFLTVFTASMITAALTVGSMAAAGVGVLKMMQDVTGSLNFSVDLSTVPLLILAMVPLGIIFSALLMTLSLFARSYKEAQSYITPLTFVVIVPAMMSLMPDTELSGRMALIPVLNVSILMKDVLIGQINPGAIALTLAVNLALAAVCLYLVLAMFRRESVLFKA